MHLFLSLASLPAVLGLALRTPPVLPTNDPFYNQPANITSYRPGEIIASRQVSTDLNGILGASLTPISIKASYQYLYRTVDSLQAPIAAVTTILVPNNANPNKLVSYQTAYDSANVNCGPSYAFQAGAKNVVATDIVMIVAALNKGYYVVSPDYEGPSAAFVSGLQAGYATLDSVRAALSTKSTNLIGLSPSANYVMWGYSGGSIATEWAAELQPTYAKELSFKGAAVGGLIGNATNVILTINKTPSAGLGFSGIQGLSNAYPQVKTLVDSSFASPEKQSEFRSIAQGCLVPAITQGANKDISSYFTDYDAFLHSPITKTIMNETGQMGHTGTPSVPIYVYKAIKDEVSPVADTDYVVKLLCANGASVNYQKNREGGHNTEAIFGFGGALSWLADRLDGKSITSTGCSTEYVTISSLSLGALLGLAAEIFSLLENILGGKIGPLYSGR